jgi:DNA ligase (NAD+)
LSWKLDGLTLVLTYDNGTISKVMTRGNGIIGTNITYLSNYIDGFPKEIPYKGHMVVRGEATISYTNFNNINALIENEDEQYANPRNLVSGTLSLDKTRANEVKERGVCFNAFTLVYIDEEMVSWGDRMNYLENLGFVVVDREFIANPNNLQVSIDKWTEKVSNGFDIPVDGLVIAFDDTEYAKTGSVTHHHATNAGYAFKWQDKPADTILDHIEWSCAASSISPVAVFKPVQLEGTIVQRASLCNISEMERLGIGANQETKLSVIKANMIIPKIIKAENNGTSFEIPTICPVCGAPTKVHVSEKTNTKTLHCTNPECNAKHIQKYTRFASKTGMDIDGLSLKTIMKFINCGFISDFASIYDISKYQDKIVDMEGFGEKSYKNLISSIEKSKQNVNYINFVYALCIPMIGTDAAKKIFNAIGSNEFNYRINNSIGFEDVDGIGPEKSNAIITWFSDKKNMELYQNLTSILNIKEIVPSTNDGKCKDLVFVITGDVHVYKNRDEFKTYVESQGGKVTGSVSKKTNYLVNNDIASNSSKNKKAKELGIPIITEDEFIEMF